jgi:hypothetical protein
MFDAVIAMGIAAAVQSLPEVTVKQVPGKGYQLTAPRFPADQGDALIAKMQTVAAQRCGKLTIRWGKFSYKTEYGDGKDPAREMRTEYSQSFSCIDPATDPYKPVPADWKASAQDDADVTAFVNRYLTAYEAADVAKGLPMMEPLLELDKAGWLAQPAAIKAVRGSGSRTIRGPFWQNNPDGASHPGAYAVFAFLGNYSGLAAHCGILVIYRAGLGKYQVSQQSIQAMARSDNPDPAAVQRACEGY